MSYGSGWGGSPWGGSSALNVIVPVVFDVEVSDHLTITTDVFTGLHQIPSFIVGAQRPTQIEVVFSVAMSIDSNFINPSCYTVTAAEGSIPISVVSVTPTGTGPIRRALLELGSDLDSKEYYSLVVSHAVVSSTGDPSDPDIYIFQWADMTTPVFGAPLEIPIGDFSGEVRGGILGNPDGQVFFTPAYDTVSGDSTIELESVSVCTRAYDEYHIPAPPDPAPLLTWRPGITSVIGPGNVLWAPADILGLPSISLGVHSQDVFQPANDFAVEAVLFEPIDITKAGFLNDARWKTFPAGGATVFRTASNLTPIGPGPTTPVKLDYPKIVINDNFPITDQLVINVQDIELDTDDVSIADGLTVQNITPGLITIAIDEAIALSDSIKTSTQYSLVLATNTLAISDSNIVEVSRANDVVVSDTITVTESTTTSRVVNLTFSDSVSVTDFTLIEKGVIADVSVSDTLSITDATTLSLVYSLTASDSVTTTDSSSLSLQYSLTLSDSVSVTDSVTGILAGSTVDVDAGTDTLTITDSKSNQVDKTLGDTVSVTDTINASFEKAVTVSDTVAVEEVIWTGAPVQYHDSTFSPVGLWQFNETFNDTSGNAFNLTAETGTVAYGDIFPGVKGVILDGVTTLVYNTSTATLGRTGDITIEMLLNLNAYTASKFLVSYSNSSSGGSTTNALYAIEMLNTGSTEFTFMQENGSNSASRTSTFTNRPTLDTLCHLAVTRTSDVIKVYLNGVLVETSSALTTATGGGSSVFRVGSHSSRGSAPACVIASLKVVASALTGTQIAQEYNLTLGRYYGEI